MRKFIEFSILCLGWLIAGCDLQPKITAIPDDIGDFISERYPTLLADPDSEIYQTAVSDYGVYSSPTEYSNGDIGIDDYVLYSSIDDYNMPNQDTEIDNFDNSVQTDEDDDVNDVFDIEDTYTPDSSVDDLTVPDYHNEKTVVVIEDDEASQHVPDVKVVQNIENKVDPRTESVSKPQIKTLNNSAGNVHFVVVQKGDTLYSLAKKYAVSVADLADANNIVAPFKISVGQRLNLPNTTNVSKQNRGDTTVANRGHIDVKQDAQKKIEARNVKPEQKPGGAKKVETKQKAQGVKTPETMRVHPDEITIQNGDTLYSLSRKYSVPVNDLAVVNKISAPFALMPGQKLKVPGRVVVSGEKSQSVNQNLKNAKKTYVQESKKSEVKPEQKIKTVDKKSVKSYTKKNNDKAAGKKNVKNKTERKTTDGAKRQNNQKMVARSSSKFSWPVRGKILSGYGAKSNGLFNDGINIRAGRGTTVVAAENGFVAYAGNEVKGMGNLVIIQHSDGWMTVYAHMDSFVVRRGHKVSVGQKIGTVGSSGKVDEPQLHFEIRKGTKAYNPVNYLKK